MKALVLATLFIITSSLAQAYIIDSKPQRNGDGSITQNITILCAADDGIFCDMVCNNEIFCEFPEPLCLDCAGTSSTLLRTIFSRVNVFYEASTQQAGLRDIAVTLSVPNYILLSTKSIYNYYKPWDSAELKQQFSSLCPRGSKVPLLLVSLDNQNRPADLVYAFCELPPEIATDKTMVFPIHPKSNPELEANFNQTPNPPTRN